MSQTYVYSMHKANKFFGPERQVLREISLCSYRARRSACSAPTAPASPRCFGSWPAWTSPRTARPGSRPARRSGTCPRSRSSTRPRRTRTWRRAHGMGAARPLQRVSARFARPIPTTRCALLDEQGEVPDRIDRTGAWGLGMLDVARDALGKPAIRGDTCRAATAARGPLPPPLAARSAAPRRADEPPGRRVVAWLEQSLDDSRRRAPRHARPLLPRQRGRLDPRARPRPRHPVPGQLLVVARAEAGAARGRGEAGVGPPAHAPARARMGADGALHTACQEQGARAGIRSAARRGEGGQAGFGRDPHSGRGAAGRRGGRDPEPAQGLRRPAADRRPQHSRSRRAASSA